MLDCKFLIFFPSIFRFVCRLYILITFSMYIFFLFVPETFCVFVSFLMVFFWIVFFFCVPHFCYLFVKCWSNLFIFPLFYFISMNFSFFHLQHSFVLCVSLCVCFISVYFLYSKSRKQTKFIKSSIENKNQNRTIHVKKTIIIFRVNRV